ncbi:MAG: redoxin domain-containing protein [Polyangiaceae bacterium]
MRNRALARVAVACLTTVACAASPARVSDVPATTLIAGDGSTVDARRLAGSARWTVLIFFAPHCHCLDAHDARIRALYEAYHPRGVEFRMVDSETRGSRERDGAEARRRGYPFAILLDPGAKLADALGAEYATYSVVVDAEGRVRYRGGIDSDKMHLHDDVRPYLRFALDDLLARRAVRIPEAKTLGCALERW